MAFQCSLGKYNLLQGLNMTKIPKTLMYTQNHGEGERNIP